MKTSNDGACCSCHLRRSDANVTVQDYQNKKDGVITLLPLHSPERNENSSLLLACSLHEAYAHRAAQRVEKSCLLGPPNMAAVACTGAVTDHPGARLLTRLRVETRSKCPPWTDAVTLIRPRLVDPCVWNVQRPFVMASRAPLVMHALGPALM
jgi:hypothetical protein